MSEQTKNKPNTAEIVVSIICVLILIVTLGLFARNVINAAREDESRRQSEADESLYRHDTIEAQRSICRRLQKAQGQRATDGQISYS